MTYKKYRVPIESYVVVEAYSELEAYREVEAIQEADDETDTEAHSIKHDLLLNASIGEPSLVEE